MDENKELDIGQKLDIIKINSIHIRNIEDIYGAASYLLNIDLHEKIDDIKEDLEKTEEKGESSNLKIMCDILGNVLWRNNEMKPYTIFIELFHIEKFYRDSYYSHISSKHFYHDRYCKRLFFIDGIQSNNILDIDEEQLNRLFLGVSVIRPSVDERGGIIGKTLLKPSLFNTEEQSFLCAANFTVHAFSKKLNIKAFPYMMQDGETITCAETTILLLMEYFGNKYPQYHSVVPSDIYKIIQENSFQRTIPSGGLTYTALSKVLVECGFFPMLYGNDINEQAVMLKRIMHYYVDSAIPVAVSLKQKYSESKGHSVICVGFKKNPTKQKPSKSNDKKSDEIVLIDSADLTDDYIIINDSTQPYTNMHFYTRSNDNECIFDGSLNISTINAEFDMSMMIVPLSQRMFLEAMDVIDIVKGILLDKSIGFNMILNMVKDQKQDFIPNASEEDPLIYRIFLSTSSSLKRKRAVSFENDDFLKKIYSSVPMPKFVWVCELYSWSSYNEQKAIGEIIFDATSYGKTTYNSIIIINYPYNIAFRLPYENPNELIKDFSVGRYYHNKWTPIDMFIHGESMEQLKNRVKNY